MSEVVVQEFIVVEDAFLQPVEYFVISGERGLQGEPFPADQQALLVQAAVDALKPQFREVNGAAIPMHEDYKNSMLLITHNDADAIVFTLLKDILAINESFEVIRGDLGDLSLAAGADVKYYPEPVLPATVHKIAEPDRSVVITRMADDGTDQVYFIRGALE
jgi:hypothetical protein